MKRGHIAKKENNEYGIPTMHLVRKELPYEKNRDAIWVEDTELPHQTTPLLPMLGQFWVGRVRNAQHSNQDWNDCAKEPNADMYYYPSSE